MFSSPGVFDFPKSSKKLDDGLFGLRARRFLCGLVGCFGCLEVELLEGHHDRSFLLLLATEAI